MGAVEDAQAAIKAAEDQLAKARKMLEEAKKTDHQAELKKQLDELGTGAAFRFGVKGEGPQTVVFVKVGSKHWRPGNTERYIRAYDKAEYTLDTLFTNAYIDTYDTLHVDFKGEKD